jgi:hypothetical protein
MNWRGCCFIIGGISDSSLYVDGNAGCNGIQNRGELYGKHNA